MHPGSEVRAEVARDMLNVQLEHVAAESNPAQIETLLVLLSGGLKLETLAR